ncbi:MULTISPECIES: inositol monophosphatase family protein [Reichenbachiella]|uniref:Inositol-1-monophosphatase n=1 Tax=Reichenbachiella agariperforans TaxID=156994 RepID=A0A1M6QB00_REIAG|nr:MULTISPECIES: inositol monophosphatase family protein [Reichenbachiella]MBU2914296.1 inositol monophosphatase [Reichenbachiella agariperforans]RJE73020.1 inositol monophosphatase [Reichenbachiella sp. MSK19-1]SHK17361.1 myo-inositol-1(or 4)-monophosphatase [Reichenbachiella agariperforans]
MNLKHITQEVVKLSIATGAFIKKEGESFDTSKIEEKGKNDLVSYVDKEAEKMIVTGLKDILPDAGFITEENTIEEDDRELKWIIDPLDGTTNFIHGLPCYSTSIALARGEELLIGVVYDIGQGECFHAYQGGGAYQDGQPIQVSPTNLIANSLIATGFPYYNFEKMDSYISILRHLMQESHGLRRMGSAAIDLVYTAIGRYEAFFEYNLNSYDVAAGALIVQEAGGQVTNFAGGKDFLFKREIVATGHIHNELLAVINKNW